MNDYAKLQKMWTIDVRETTSNPNDIRLSVIIPFYRAGCIGWIPFEALIRQIDVNFQWELLIIEEDFDNPFGYSQALQYWDALNKAGCRRLKYFSLSKWMPLSMKWYHLIHSTDSQSEVICCNAADIYMSRRRLSAQFDILGNQSKYNWHKLNGNISYDLQSDKHAKNFPIDKNRPDNCCRAARSELFKQLPLISRNVGVDGWTYNSLLPQIKFYYDESDDLWRETVNITGLNNISLGRGERIRQAMPPLSKCCDGLQGHLPPEVIAQLLECRKYLDGHKKLLESTANIRGRKVEI